MNYSFRLIITKIDLIGFAAITLQLHEEFSRIYLFPRYAQYWEWDPISKLKVDHSLYMGDLDGIGLI